jgi:hypothetical protein
MRSLSSDYWASAKAQRAMLPAGKASQHHRSTGARPPWWASAFLSESTGTGRRYERLSRVPVARPARRPSSTR